MSRKEALKALLAKVEAGENPSQAEWAVAFPDTPDDDDYPRSMMAVNAAVGWLDAAKALHEVLLPGWHWSVEDNDQAEVFQPVAQHVGGVFMSGKHELSGPDTVGTPARAWLAAILKALIAEADQ